MHRLKCHVPISFRSTLLPGVLVDVAEIELPCVSSAETSVAVDASVLFSKEDAGVYRLWEGRTWQRTNRPAPGVYGMLDNSIVTKDRMVGSGKRMLHAIDEYERVRKAKDHSKPSILANADDKAVRHAFSSRFSDCQSSDLKGRFVRACPPEAAEDLELARAVAVRLAGQSLLIDGYLWVSTPGPMLSPQPRGTRPCIRVAHDYDWPRPGLALAVHDPDRLQQLLRDTPGFPGLNAATLKAIERLRFDPEFDFSKVDAYNAYGLGWMALSMLAACDPDALPTEILDEYVQLRELLEKHAALDGTPIRPDRDYPFESSQDNFVDPDTIWETVEHLLPYLRTHARPTGGGSIKDDMRWMIALSLAGNRYDMARMRGIAA